MIKNTAQKQGFTYTGRLLELYALWIFNAILSLLTLGLYHFRARTTFRKYLCENFSFLGKTVRYTGTARELCWGLIKAIGIFACFLGFIFGMRLLLVTHFSPDMQAENLELPYFYVYVSLDLLWLLVMQFFYCMARYGNLRYRLTRTQWQGIKFYMPPFSFDFISLILKCWAIKIVSLGILIPKMDLRLMHYYAERIYLGNTIVDLGNAKVPERLFCINLQTLLLAVPTLGLSRFWYQAALYQHVIQTFCVGPIKLSSTFSAKDLLSLTLGNWAIGLLTLGLGFPIIVQRKMHFIARHIAVLGDEEGLKNLHIHTRKTSPVSEGLDTVLGFGAAI